MLNNQSKKGQSRLLLGFVVHSGFSEHYPNPLHYMSSCVSPHFSCIWLLFSINNFVLWKVYALH